MENLNDIYVEREKIKIKVIVLNVYRKLCERRKMREKFLLSAVLS